MARACSTWSDRSVGSIFAMSWPSSTTSPTLVDVPCPSTLSPGSGATPTRSQARSTASFWPIGLGAVMPLPLPSELAPMPRMTA